MTDAQLEAMQRLARALTSIPSWINLPSGLAPLAGWRWFIDGDFIVLEPSAGGIQPRHMAFLDMHTRITDVEAVFRASPSPGVYLRCKLTAEES